MSGQPASGKGAVLGAALVGLVLVAGCGPHGPGSEDGVQQTKFPGMVSAGGGTSGEVIARTGGKQAPPPAGTPGIPQGAGGNTGGAAPGGTVAKGDAGTSGVPAGEGPQKAASAAADPGASGVVPPGVSASAATSSGAAVGGLSNVPGAVAGTSSGAAAGGSRPASSPGVR
jgi:hypothetical protein